MKATFQPPGFYLRPPAHIIRQPDRNFIGLASPPSDGGSFSEVYSFNVATDDGNTVPARLKVFKDCAVKIDPDEDVREFSSWDWWPRDWWQTEREYRILDRVNGLEDHLGRHAPRCFAYGTVVSSDGNARPAILMEDLTPSGFRRLSDIPGSWTAKATAEFGLEMLGIIEKLDYYGVTHSDLSGNNVFFNERARSDSSRVAVIDFGQSKESGWHVTPSNKNPRLGTLSFSAPEVMPFNISLSAIDPDDMTAAERQAYTESLATDRAFQKLHNTRYSKRNNTTVDIWSLGALMFARRTGRVPASRVRYRPGTGDYMDTATRRTLSQDEALCLVIREKQDGLSLASIESARDNWLDAAIRLCTLPEPDARDTSLIRGCLLNAAGKPGGLTTMPDPGFFEATPAAPVVPTAPARTASDVYGGFYTLHRPDNSRLDPTRRADILCLASSPGALVPEGDPIWVEEEGCKCTFRCVGNPFPMSRHSDSLEFQFGDAGDALGGTADVLGNVLQWTGSLDTPADFARFVRHKIYTAPGSTLFADIAYVLFVDDVVPKDTANWFLGCKHLKAVLELHRLDTSLATNMRAMFCDCSSLEALDLSTFDTSSVENMSSLVAGCTALQTLRVTGFDVSHVKKSRGMCARTPKLETIEGWRLNFSDKAAVRGMFWHNPWGNKQAGPGALGFGPEEFRIPTGQLALNFFTRKPYMILVLFYAATLLLAAAWQGGVPVWSDIMNAVSGYHDWVYDTVTGFFA